MGLSSQYWNEVTVGLPHGFPFHPVQAAFGAVFAVAPGGLIVDSGKRRMAAAACTIPLAVVASFMIGALRSAVGI